jgi:hypothetical protein
MTFDEKEFEKFKEETKKIELGEIMDRIIEKAKHKNGISIARMMFVLSRMEDDISVDNKLLIACFIAQKFMSYLDINIEEVSLNDKENKETLH